jgi:hypothetical protein
MSKKQMSAAANVETVETVETAPVTMSQEDQLTALNDELAAAKHAVRMSDDDTYDAAAANVSRIKLQISQLEKAAAAEREIAEANEKRETRRNILMDMIAAQIKAAKNPDDEQLATIAADFLQPVMDEWMAKYAAVPAAAPRKQRATNGTVDDDGKLSTTKPELTALYNEAAKTTPFQTISDNFYDKYKRSTVWHTLNDIKTGKIAVPFIAVGHE